MKQFKTESKRILDLMINSIYTNKEIFLRELISNASDAIDKLKFISLTDSKVNSDFEILITADKTTNTLTISDNGVGMTEKELEENLGTIAKSGTFAFKKENSDKTEEQLIGQFGVGFYSAFMVADKIQVFTKAYGADKAFMWESEGASGYTISECDKEANGTKIVLTLKADTEDEKYSDYLSAYRISALVKKYSDYIRYPIKMMMDKRIPVEGAENGKPEYTTVSELTTLNSMVPLWKKPKAEVKKEDLDEFYKNEFYDFSSPVKSIYSKIEGSVTYDTLLFVPEKAPYDYYSKEYKKGVKLYANGVMIMEKCEDLLPDCFGFIKGIVDSSDLNLNISREILQQDRQVKAISQSLEKKIVSELKKTIDSERDVYEKIFSEFGLSIKFGVYQNFGQKKEMLKDLLMFYSSKKSSLITLSEYVSTMSEDQKEIFYACGNSYEAISKLPQVEKAIDKGYDILFMKDDVDEFVIKVLSEFDGKKFKSVSDADFSINDGEKEEALEKSKEYKSITDFAKDVLEGEVKEVRLSFNLKTYPCYLSSDGEISIEMEKVLSAMPNASQVKAEKILELNADHDVTKKLKTLFDTDKEALKKYVKVLYNGARLLEGLPIKNVSEFITDLSDIM